MERLLIIEDNDTIRLGMGQTLERAGFTVQLAASGREGLRLATEFQPDCVITDLKLGDLDGIEVLRRLHESQPELPVMIVTAFGTVEKAVEAMKLGAFDFITKPFPPDLLRVKVRQALDVVRLSRDRDKLFYENQYLRSAAQERFADHELLGESAAMREVLSQIRKVARTDTTVFIQGESGTGKELAARAIHMQSPRHDKPFITVNCSALAEGLLESELFGHERGAFTGALKRKPGRFELADGGSLFLDEIGDIHHSVQLKLLRVLQEREFERVGGTQTLKIDVRIISATNQNLKERVAQGLFREDLFYRLVIVPIHLPPLRQRREDIPTLAEAFLRRLEARHHRGVHGITAKALESLKNYDWPGNVRELENLLEQAYIFCENKQLDTHNFPKFLRNSDNSSIIGESLGSTPLPDLLDRLEKQLLLQAIREAGGVKTRMAKLLGIKTSALYYKLEKHGLIDALSKEE